MPTGIGGSFQLANSAPPLGVTGSASAPTARMGFQRARPRGLEICRPRDAEAGAKCTGLHWSTYYHNARLARASGRGLSAGSPEGVRALGESAMPGHVRDRRRASPTARPPPRKITVIR